MESGLGLGGTNKKKTKLREFHIYSSSTGEPHPLPTPAPAPWTEPPKSYREPVLKKRPQSVFGKDVNRIKDVALTVKKPSASLSSQSSTTQSDMCTGKGLGRNEKELKSTSRGVKGARPKLDTFEVANPVEFDEGLDWTKLDTEVAKPVESDEGLDWTKLDTFEVAKPVEFDEGFDWTTKLDCCRERLILGLFLSQLSLIYHDIQS